MRVTSTGVAATLSAALNAAAERAARANEQLGTGEKVRRVSDSPADASQLLRLDSSLAAVDGYYRNASDANAWLNTIDAALQGTLDVYRRADDLALAAANASRDTGQRKAIADEVRALAEQMGGLVNTTYLGQSVFAGHSTQAVTQDPALGTWSFTGTTGEVLREVDAATVMNVAADGQEVFGFSSGTDVFTALSDLADAIEAGSVSGISAGRGTLGGLTDKAAQALETTGIRARSLDQVRDRLELTTINTERARAEIGEVDLAKAVLEVQSAKTAYEAALAAIAKTSLASLADFL